MRLIDADALIYEDLECTDGNTYMVLHAPMIDKQQTAYDVDKVVEQLETARDGYSTAQLMTANNEFAKRFIAKEKAMNLAIEIVKAGGIDGN